MWFREGRRKEKRGEANIDTCLLLNHRGVGDHQRNSRQIEGKGKKGALSGSLRKVLPARLSRALPAKRGDKNEAARSIRRLVSVEFIGDAAGRPATKGRGHRVNILDPYIVYHRLRHGENSRG